MAGNKDFNLNVNIFGKATISTVPNNIGTVVTWDSATKELSTRTNSQFIGDLGLATQSWVTSQNYLTSSNLAGYVPYTGATQNIDLNNKSINNVRSLSKTGEGQIRIFDKVYQKNYYTSAPTGILSIKIPQPFNSAQAMFKATINLFSYSKSSFATLEVSFYKYLTSSIYTVGCSAQIKKTNGFPSVPVNVGVDASNNICINLGESTTDWSTHLHFELDKLQVSYDDYDNDWASGVTSATETDVSSYLSLVNIPVEEVATSNNAVLTYGDQPHIDGKKGFNQIVETKKGTIKKNGYNYGNKSVRTYPAHFNFWGGSTGAIIIDCGSPTGFSLGSYFEIKLWGHASIRSQTLKVDYYTNGAYNYAILENDSDVSNFVTSVKLGTMPNGNVCLILNNVSSTYNYLSVLVEKFYAGISNQSAIEGNWNIQLVTDLTGYTIAANLNLKSVQTPTPAQITNWNAAYNWGNHANAGYVLQSNLNTQLANYATLAGTQTFAGTNTFSVSPIVPNGTLAGHAVNLGQLNNKSDVGHTHTKAEVGLGNVDNTADSVKNVATAGNLRSNLITLTQLNSFDLEPGMYRIEGVNLGISTGSYHHIIQTGKYSGGGHISQIAIPFDGGVNNSMYLRVAGYTAWGNWERLAKNSDIIATINALNLGGTYAPVSHNHTIAQVTGLQSALDGKEPVFAKNSAFNKNFGTVTGTVAEGNDSRINNGQTAYGWGDHAAQNYATQTWVYDNFIRPNISFNYYTSTANGNVSLNDSIHGSEAGLYNDENAIAAIDGGYYKYGSEYNEYDGINIHKTYKDVAIGASSQRVAKLEVTGRIAVPDVNGTLGVLDPVGITANDFTGMREFLIHALVDDDVYLPSGGIEGQKVIIHAISDTEPKVYASPIATSELFQMSSENNKAECIYIGGAWHVEFSHYTKYI